MCLKPELLAPGARVSYRKHRKNYCFTGVDALKRNIIFFGLRLPKNMVGDSLFKKGIFFNEIRYPKQNFPLGTHKTDEIYYFIYVY